MAQETKGRAPDYRAFTVKGEGDDAWWTRIGSAWKFSVPRYFTWVV